MRIVSWKSKFEIYFCFYSWLNFEYIWKLSSASIKSWASLSFDQWNRWRPQKFYHGKKKSQTKADWAIKSISVINSSAGLSVQKTSRNLDRVKVNICYLSPLSFEGKYVLSEQQAIEIMHCTL